MRAWRILWALGSLCVLHWVGATPNQVPARSSAALIQAEDWGHFQDGKRRMHRHATSGNAGAATALNDRQDGRVDSTQGYDALAYEADLRLDFGPPSWWQATVRMDFQALNTLDTLMLHLRGYTLDSVMVNGTPRSFQRQEDLLRIALDGAPILPGDSARLEVSYRGTPVWQNGLGLSVSGQIAYTLSDPWGTRNWLACHDEPFDKARWALNLRCDSSFAVLSNGHLLGVEAHGDGSATWRYRHPSPMSSYLVSVVCGRLSQLEDAWQDLPLRWFVYPQHVAPAWQAVSRVGDMFDCFTSLWGPYPFESYAMGEAPIYGGMGGMEHQTCTTIGSGIVAGGLAYESIIAHELSHMWWGDSVTPVDFQHVWLNEGWATYAEAYFYQHLADGDEAAFLAYLAQLQATYLAWDSQFAPIFDPPDDNLFTVNQYEKAACVLHMLRQIMGEEAFHSAQRAWHQAHRFGTVNTADYQAAMEAACGLELDQFFHQWIYTGGYPTYRTVTEHRDEGGSCRVHLVVNQSHPWLENFRAPIPVQVRSSLATLDTLVWIEAASSAFSWSLPGTFDTLIFNHNHPVLCRHEVLPAQGGTPLWQVLAWDLDDSLDGNGDGHLAAGERASVSLTVQNLGGWDTDLSFSLSSNELEVEGQWPVWPDAGGGSVVVLPHGWLSVSAPSGTGMWWSPLQLLSASDHFPPQVTPFSLPLGDPWLRLLVPEGQEDVAPWLRRDLDSLVVFTDLEILDASALPAPLAPLHRSLLWLGGDAGHPLSPGQLVWVRDALENTPCTLLLSGQDLVDNAQEGELPCALVTQHEDLADRWVDGESGSALEGLSALLLGAGGAGNQVDPSSLTWLECGTAVHVLARYHNSQEVALAQVDLPNGSRLLVAGFGLEAISGMAGSNSRQQWLEAIVPQLDQESPLPRSRTPQLPWAGRPGTTHLHAVHPNPANGRVQVAFQWEVPGQAKLLLYDLSGSLRATLLDAPLSAGLHRATYESQGLSSGLYLVVLESGERRWAQKLILLK